MSWPNLKFENPIFREGMQQTIRVMEHKPAGRFFNILNKEGKKIGQGSVYLVEQYPLRKLPFNIIGMSHDPKCQTNIALSQALYKYYPDITLDTVVTVIWFHVLPFGKIGEELGITPEWAKGQKGPTMEDIKQRCSTTPYIPRGFDPSKVQFNEFKPDFDFPAAGAMFMIFQEDE